MKIASRSPAQTKQIAADFAKKLPPTAVIALIGDLGVGKTTFVQGLAAGLGIDPKDYVNSPTFTLINEYRNLIHVDLYRIEKPDETETLALEEYLVPGNIVVIEWAEKLPAFLKSFDFEVRFREISDKEREIEIYGL